jgi:hypothetical protein
VSRVAGPALCGSLRSRITPRSKLDVPAVCGLLRNRHFPSHVSRRGDSAVNTWRRAPSADCSAFNSLRSRCAWIAPRSTLKSFRTACGLLRTRSSAFRASFGLLLDWLFPPCTSRESLHSRRLTLRDGLRIAPYATTSRPCAVHGLLRAQRFKLRTGHRLLCVRRLRLCSNCGLLRLPHLAPCVLRELLREKHLEFCAESVVLRIRHLSLRPVHRLLGLRHLDLPPHTACAGCFS